jgi:hypothetical protein
MENVMTKPAPPVTAMFLDMVLSGQITPVTHMESLRLPGEYLVVPTITTCGTPDLPIRFGADTDAKLGQRSQGNIPNPNYVE